MEMAFQKTQAPCLVGTVREVQNSEQTQELRLPDGFPDVGKVLCAWGQTILRGKEWRSDSILVSGGMLMWVLYAPEDGSQPRVLDGWLPFQMRWQLPQDCPEGNIRISALTRFADARSVSPRKLMLRGGIGILAEIWSPTQLEYWQCGEAPQGVELLRRRYPLRLYREAGEKNFTLEEDLTPGLEPEGVLYYTLRPEIVEEKVLSGKIAFRGNANLHVLLQCQDGKVLSQDFQLPFSQFAELEESYSPESQVNVVCAVTNLELERQEGGGLRARCGLSAQYLVDDVTAVETVADAYLPGIPLQLQTQQLDAPAVLEKRTDTVSAEVNLSGNPGQVEDVSFLPDHPRQYRENGSLVLEIPGTIQVLSRDEQGNLRAQSGRWEGKLQMSMGENTQLTVHPLAPPMPQSTAGGYRGELPLRLSTTGGQGIPMVTSLEQPVDASADPQRPSLVLRRAGGESLWDIAKKCGSTVAAIRSANKLQEEPKPGQILLIPVC